MRNTSEREKYDDNDDGTVQSEIEGLLSWLLIAYASMLASVQLSKKKNLFHFETLAF